MSEASKYNCGNSSCVNIHNSPLFSLSAPEYTRQGHRWFPEHRSRLIGSRLSNASSATTLSCRVTQPPTGTLYPNIWVICMSPLFYDRSSLIADVSVVSVHVIRLRPLFHTFAGNSVAVLISQGSFRPSWTLSFLIARPFPTSPSFRTFLI